VGHSASQERRDGPQRSERANQVLLRDHDAKFARSFDDVFGSEGVQVLQTHPGDEGERLRQRWVQTVRAECLDWTLVLGRRHLRRLLRGCVRHYNQQRPHRCLTLAAPEPEMREHGPPQVNPRDIGRRDVLGGPIHEYHEVAA
jgi:putative transposase